MEEIRAHPRIGVDLESNGFFRYPERVCLVQVSTPRRGFLLDPLSIGNMTPLGDALGDEGVETILHSGSHDVVSLDRDWGFRVGRLFDTSIGAAFVGMRRLGLAAALSEMLGVDIPKQKKIQRSDWSRRPLSDEALAYAAADVEHLHRLRETLGARLRKLGRERWVEEECARLRGMRYKPPDREMAVFNVKGWRRLDDRGLAILKALVEYRDERAFEMDRPPFRVMPNMALIAIAANPDADLRGVRGIGRYARGSSAAGLRRAIAAGKEAAPPRPPSPPPTRRLPRSEQAEAGRRLAKLKAWRVARAEELALDPALLWPTKSLQRIARFPDTLDAEMNDDAVRDWQREEFEREIRDALLK